MTLRPNGKPQFSSQPITPAKEQLGLLGAGRHGRRDRDTGLYCGSDVAGAAVEVNGVRARRGPVRVVVSAGKNEHNRIRMQGRSGIFGACLDDPGPAKPAIDRSQKQSVVGQRVEGALVTEGFVERRRQDPRVRREHAAGVVGHHQRPASGWDVVRSSHLSAKPAADHWSGQFLELLGERRIPLDDLVIFRRVDRTWQVNATLYFGE